MQVCSRGAMVAIALLLYGCKTDCQSDVPALRVTVLLGQSLDAARLKTLRVDATINGMTRRQDIALGRAFSDRAATFELFLGDAGRTAYEGSLTVSALDEAGIPQANASLTWQGEADACKLLTLSLTRKGADDGGSLDGGQDAKPDGNRCGNGTIDPGEACDGANTAGRTCLSEGAQAGTLVCKKDCTALDYAACTWARIGIGTSSSISQSLAVALDRQGDVVITGKFSGTVAFGDAPALTALGGSDIFVARLSPSGKVRWAKALGGKGTYEQGSDVALDSNGNAYLVGVYGESKATLPLTYNGTSTLLSKGGTDILVAKLDTQGKVVWISGEGGTGALADEYGSGIALDASDNVYIAATLHNLPVTFGSPACARCTADPGALSQGSLVVAKLSASGSYQWVKAGGGSGVWGVGRLAADPAGNTCVHLLQSGAATFDAQKAPYLAGSQNTAVVRLDAAGLVFQWVMGLGYTSKWSESGSALAADANGDCLLAGKYEGSLSLETLTPGSPFAATSQGKADVLVARLDAKTGKGVWAATAGGAEEDGGRGLAVNASGQALIAGVLGKGPATFGSALVTGAADTNILVARTKPMSGSLPHKGQFDWVVSPGGAAMAHDLAMDSNGVLYITGYIHDKVTLGTATIDSASAQSAFIWKMGPAGPSSP